MVELTPGAKHGELKGKAWERERSLYFDFPTIVLMVVLCYCPKLQPRPISLPLAFDG
jgi:hypothetical protein